MNEWIFLDILERKIQSVGKGLNAMCNEITVVVWIRGISVVTCIEIWKRFLVQRVMLVKKIFGMQFSSSWLLLCLTQPEQGP